MGFEPTTLRDLVGCSNHLSYWRLYGEQGPICGSRLEPHHAATQPSNDCNISKTSARVSKGVPNTEKQMKERGRNFIASRCLEPLMKPEARVFEMTSQTIQLKNMQ